LGLSVLVGIGLFWLLFILDPAETPKPLKTDDGVPCVQKTAGNSTTATAVTVPPAAKSGRRARGKKAKKLPKQEKLQSLEATSPPGPVNVSQDEGSANVDIVVAASPALPGKVTAEDIKIEVPQRPRRTNEKIATEFLPRPMATKPIIIEGRKSIAFSLCFDNAHIEAGTYAGQVIVGAPGFQQAAVTVTVNDKNSLLFYRGLALAIFVAVLLLIYQAGEVAWQKQKEEKDKDPNAPDPSTRAALKVPLCDLFGFWGPTLLAAGAAVVATWGVYSTDLAWGADKGSSIIALIGTALAAAGLGTLLSGVRKS
jgi:hypothetical protein